MVKKRAGGASAPEAGAPPAGKPEKYTSTNGTAQEDPTLFREERVAEVVLTRIPLDLIVENELNPNQQKASTFEGLQRDIEEDGFDEPPQVVPMWGNPKDKTTWSMSCPPDPPGTSPNKAAPSFYRLSGGQWRCRALRAKGYTHVDCVVKLGWDEIKFQIKTTRRNLQRGDLNAERFTAQVNELITSYGQKVDDLPMLMGFETTHEFLAHYKREEENRRQTQTNLEKLANDADDKLAAVDNIEMVLTELLRRYGDTLPNDFAHFFFKRKWHLMVRLDESAKKSVAEMVKFLKAEAKDAADFEEKGFPITANPSVNAFLVTAIQAELERRLVAKEKATAAVAPPDEAK